MNTGNMTSGRSAIYQVPNRFMVPVVAVLGIGVAGICTGILIGSLPSMMIAMLSAGLLALVITLTRPDLALCLYFAGVVMMTDSIPKGSVDFFFIPDADVITGLPAILTSFFLMVMGLTVVRRVLVDRQGLPVSLRTLIPYAAILFLALATGLAHSDDRVMIKVDLIGMLFPVLCFYLCLMILTTPQRTHRLLMVLLAASTIKALILTGYYLAGRGWIYQLDQGPAYRITTMDSADLLVFITLLLIAAHLLVRRDIRGFKAALTGAACLPMLFVVIFSYRRAQWVGLAFSLGLLYLGASKTIRRKMVLLFLATLLGGSAVAVSSGLSQEKMALIATRITSIFDGKQSSNVYHALESKQVLKDLADSPLFGLGLGSHHSSLGLYDEDEVPTNVVHNTFLYIWMKTGLPGLLFLFWLARIYFRKIIQFRQQHIANDAWGLILPLAASSGLWLAKFLTGPVPWYLHQTGLIALFSAIVVALIRLTPQNAPQQPEVNL